MWVHKLVGDPCGQTFKSSIYHGLIVTISAHAVENSCSDHAAHESKASFQLAVLDQLDRRGHKWPVAEVCPKRKANPRQVLNSPQAKGWLILEIVPPTKRL